MERAEEVEDGDEGKRPKPKRKFEPSSIARTTSFNVETAATGKSRCQRCFKLVKQGDVRLVVKAKTDRFLRKIGLCNECSHEVVMAWYGEIARVGTTLCNPKVRCPKCKDHGPMQFEKDVLQKNHNYKSGWVCVAMGHFFGKLRQILWPVRKRL